MFDDNRFQLLEAQTASVRAPLPWRRDHIWINPKIDVSSGRADESLREIGYLTAFIGRNGSGKTHLLAAIAESFVILEKLKTFNKPSSIHLPLQKLRYRIGRDEFLIEQAVGGYAIFQNNSRVKIEALRLPTKVVASTVTPFDKFYIPRSIANSVKPVKASIYRYLGLRDRTGRASIDNLLYRSITSLFETSFNEALKRVRVRKVFEFLGLQPELRVVYRVAIPRELLKTLREREPFVNEKAIRNSVRLRRVRDMIKNQETSENELARLLLLAQETSQRGFLSIEANFAHGGSYNQIFAEIMPLRRAGFLQLRAVEIKYQNGNISDLKRTSSGQLSMITALLSLASEIQDGSLVLIDEPEISLHPAWQLRYIDLLLQTFENYSGCHFIIATHSPLVISELPKGAVVVSLESDASSNVDALSGQSSDVVLAEAFRVVTNNNLYIEKEIVEVLRLAADGLSDDELFHRKVSHLQYLGKCMTKDSPVRSVIEGLGDALEEASKY